MSFTSKVRNNFTNTGPNIPNEFHEYIAQLQQVIVMQNVLPQPKLF